jgi:hypothetical protein
MMRRATETKPSVPDGCAHDLLRVLETARRFIACRERAATTAAPAATLAEAIERDFLAFDLSRAERELRDAVIAIDPELTIDDTCRRGPNGTDQG